MSSMHAGACLCGGVRFEVRGTFNAFYLCYCRRCRKGTGSAHGANLFSGTATLTWLQGKELVRVFRLPETRHVRGFCRVCGSALPVQDADTGLLMVPAGSLDTPVLLRPKARLFVGSRAGWTHGLETVPGFDALPEQR
ncbi:GFA family protein [Oceanimonas sp. CHS3-5]|uniref:GFA family protein n=1 Tax=Oceanimonas sp. CHS3-5 TaxID=3068186 RepID=UPI00273DE2B7|nr:GFA family protein [Oceanimonas sp. CHS3-5]MDP5291120.1 GFA family protein [Oceanimonas sp. CHS3-5]